MDDPQSPLHDDPNNKASFGPAAGDGTSGHSPSAGGGHVEDLAPHSASVTPSPSSNSDLPMMHDMLSSSHAVSPETTRVNDTPSLDTHTADVRADAAHGLLATFGLDGRPHLQKALEGLDLNTSSLYNAVADYLAERANVASRPLLGTAEAPETTQAAAQYIRTEILRYVQVRKINALQEEQMRLEQQLNAQRRRLRERMQAQNVAPSDLDTVAWDVDVFRLGVCYAPDDDLFGLVGTMAGMGDGELATMAEEGLFPEPMKARMVRIREALELDVISLVRDWAVLLMEQPDAASRRWAARQVIDPDAAEALLQRLQEENQDEEGIPKLLVFLAYRRLVQVGRIEPDDSHSAH